MRTAAFVRPCTSSRVASAGSSRTARSASGSELDALDTLVEHDLAVERAMHRALRRDDLQALDLLVGQARRHPQRERELRRAAALGGRVLALDLDRAEVPALAIGVHLHRHRRARGEAGGEQLLGRGGGVVAALVARLVAVQAVLTHLDDVAKTADPMR